MEQSEPQKFTKKQMEDKIRKARWQKEQRKAGKHVAKPGKLNQGQIDQLYQIWIAVAKAKKQTNMGRKILHKFPNGEYWAEVFCKPGDKTLRSGCLNRAQFAEFNNKGLLDPAEWEMDATQWSEYKKKVFQEYHKLGMQMIKDAKKDKE